MSESVRYACGTAEVSHGRAFPDDDGLHDSSSPDIPKSTFLSRRLEAYLASVDWHGRRREVLISQGAGTALVGMSLLEGGRLIRDVMDGGDVTIEKLL